MSVKLASSRVPLRSADSSLRASHITRIHGLGRRWGSACTWLTKTPETISPEDIISSIPSIHDQAISNAVPLLLVTPSLAHLLDPTSPFLAEFMRKLYQSSPNKPDIVHAIAAVVDKIPNSTAQSQASLGEYEGLSSLIVGVNDVQWKAAPPRRIKGPADEEPNLVVSVRDQASAHAVGLRLANTVFVNGKERTFLGMRWTASGDGFVLDKSVGLASCNITTTEARVHPGVVLPLHPVSQRRKVITGMGNILRQLAKSTDSSSDEPMPASTELEKKLPRYIEEHNIADRRVSVWALVERADMDVAIETSSTQDRLTQSLRQGGKLHRVMSGGGGWGKKQGLLSLDPEVAFPTTIPQDQNVGLDQLFNSNPSPDEPLEMPSLFKSSLIGEDLSHLSQVATPGDFIQFFVSVEPTASYSTSHEAERKYCFGVVSETEEPEKPNISGEEKHLHLIPNTFAAISEKAITYSQPVLQAGTSVESSTKLDIPGCRVILESGRH